ncbi:MAG: tRNA (adenosine(37)-N6)-threonylcarbamoyltransferase complex ATPase subunit type 1 TsaE [bacterium]|nr:tRNA (adenosine(37)-N6)-threonylcarbamoyltransferase complex ATPase subunit type 1 TsaE [bacterium]
MPSRNLTDNFDYTLANLADAAKWVIRQAGSQKLWCFDGEMGAGKTTLVAAICKELQVVSEVSSPTFSLVNEYLTKGGEVIYHFDFYRIKDIEEVYDIGYEMYFDSGHVCLIEWPDKILELLDFEEFISFEISVDETNRRVRLV